MAQYKKGFFISILVFTLAMLVNKLLLVFTFRYEIAGLEPYFTYLALKADSGQLYSNPEHFPFIVTQYSPIYFYVVNFFGLLLENLGINEVRSVYVVGRLLNLVCNLSTCYFIYQFFRKYLKVTFLDATIMVLIVFNLFINHNIGVRPDSLKILFITLMYIEVFHYIQYKKIKNCIVFSIYAIMALLSKQDALIHVFVALVILVIYRRFYSGILSGFLIGLISGTIILALCDWSFDQVYLNLIGGISQGINPTWFLEIIRLNYLTFTIQIVFLILLLYWIIKENRNNWFLILLLILYFAPMAALFKWGSNFNYFIEFQIIVIVLLFNIAFKQNKLGLKIFLYIGIFGIYFNNFQNKNVTLPNFWVERDAISIFKADRKASDKIITKYLEPEQLKIICFSLIYPLFLNHYSIQWAIVNDYPEIFLNNLEALSVELPKKVFDYNYDCSLDPMKKNIFMAPTENNDWYVAKLKEAFKQDKPFKLEKLDDFEIFSFHLINCE